MRRAPSWSKRAPMLLAGALLASVAWFGYQASAAGPSSTPPPLTYQGQLFVNGTPIADDTYTLSINIFKDQAATNHVCGDTNFSAATTGGWFRHTMQDTACASGIAEAAGSPLWVQVSGKGGALGNTSQSVILATNPIATGITTLHAATGGGVVGDIVASMLTPSEFTAIRGPDWVLADGGSYSSSRYAQITGNTTVPDLRGVFLRGENGSRADSKGNPDGDTAPGTYQADQFKQHHHNVSPGASGVVVAGGTPGAIFPAPPGTSGTAVIDPHGLTGDAGGAETRPRNVTVNYYIKIN